VADLATLQRRFYHLVTAHLPAPGLVQGDAAIYARMYACRLYDVLHDDYPKLRAALGDVFAPLVHRYIRERPPRSFTLRDAGAALPAFLRDADPPWAAELAALERARIEMFDAADAAPLVRADVTALPEDTLPALRLQWIPAATVLSLAWSVDDVWTAVEDSCPIPSPRPATRHVLVWRAGTTVYHRTLDPDEAALAGQLAAGATFGELAAALGDPVRLVTLVLRWIDAEVASKN
jgi:hypothetical protein